MRPLLPPLFVHPLSPSGLPLAPLPPMQALAPWPPTHPCIFSPALPPIRTGDRGHAHLRAAGRAAGPDARAHAAREARQEDKVPACLAHATPSSTDRWSAPDAVSLPHSSSCSASTAPSPSPQCSTGMSHATCRSNGSSSSLGWPAWPEASRTLCSRWYSIASNCPGFPTLVAAGARPSWWCRRCCYSRLGSGSSASSCCRRGRRRRAT